ncbi:hypothetical protein [Spirosoma endophyticum]|uniref:Uncharacterized protein n=1 Tax=Spirosoma endophyticum TaxID=662367 RepID=A0A1I1MDJ3_9BACT|nr:hypothetical protein [Spirosoma endophyticum]SFC83196.1 hypothetical protein SAMN05216167_102533 [Spirosoma endophyticum]
MSSQVKFKVTVRAASSSPWDFQPINKEQILAHTIKSLYMQAHKRCEEIAQRNYPIRYDPKQGRYIGKVEEHFVDKARLMVYEGAFAGENFYQTQQGRVEWYYADGHQSYTFNPGFYCDYVFVLSDFT